MFQHVTTHIKMMAEAEQQKKYGPYVYMSLDTYCTRKPKAEHSF